MSVDPDQVTFIGEDLARPECVLATRAGALFVSDWGGGVTRIGPDGRQSRILARNIAGLRPNGIALSPDGTFLIAHLGADDGGVFRLSRDGDAAPLLTEVEGVALPPTNFVLDDQRGRVWITVSTRRKPRDLGYRREGGDGFIVLLDGRGARIAADALGYTNEAAIHPSGDWLYVNETFARRLTRFRLADDGTLNERQTVAELGSGSFPDGLCFDAEGGAWITSIVSNRVIRVAPDGTQAVFLEDSDPDHLAWVEAAYGDGTMGRPHLDEVKSRRLRNLSSLAFGGPDLRVGYLGCLLGERIGRLAMPVAGHPPAHWEVAA